MIAVVCADDWKVMLLLTIVGVIGYFIGKEGGGGA